MLCLRCLVKNFRLIQSSFLSESFGQDVHHDVNHHQRLQGPGEDGEEGPVRDPQPRGDPEDERH